MSVRHAFSCNLIAVLIGCAGCATRITAPTNVTDPVRVYVADYGYHSSLVLPRGRERLSEFAYGQWDWFVLNQDHWYRAVPTLLVPQKGALGTRSIAYHSDPEAVRVALHATEVWPLCVERPRVIRLLAQLDRRFLEASGDNTYNPINELHFISDELYSGARQCNHRVNHWLRELGCKVTDGLSIALIEVEHPSGATEDRSN